MFKLMDKKIITILCKLFLLNWPYVQMWVVFSIYSQIDGAISNHHVDEDDLHLHCFQKRE